MELGIAPDDDSLFEEVTEKQKKPPHPQLYTIRNCYPLWFFNKKSSSAWEPETEVAVMKYQGDHYYSVGQYSSALCCFQRSQEMLSGTSNSAVWRDMKEGKSRCLMHLSRYHEALECAQHLAAVAQNRDQITSVLHLMLNIRQRMADRQEEQTLLKKLLLLHPHSPRLWIQLGDAVSASKDCCHCRPADSSATDEAAVIHNESSTNPGISPSDRIVQGSGILLTGRTDETLTSDSEPSVLSERDCIDCDGDSSSISQRTCTSLKFAVCAAVIQRLTCYTAAALLLKREQTQVAATSFVKKCNEELLQKVQQNIDHIDVPTSVHKTCREFVQRTLSSSEVDTESSSENNHTTEAAYVHEITKSTSDVIQRFYDRWFAWFTHETAVSSHRDSFTSYQVQ